MSFGGKHLTDLIHAAQRHRLTFLKVEKKDTLIEITLSAAPPLAEPTRAAETNEQAAFIRSPFVGYFREAAEVFAIGSDVREDTMVGVVEALGLPNEVRAGVSGRVAEVLIAEGQPVEYGQPLARITKTNS